MHHSDWLLAIIIKIKPSPDRVAPMFKVKTANAEYVRPAVDIPFMSVTLIMLN